MKAARVISVGSLAIATLLVVAAGAHRLQGLSSPGYVHSPLIMIEVLALLASLALALPQLIATIYLLFKWKEDRTWGWIGIAAVLLLPTAVVAAIVIDAPTLVYAT